MATAILDTNDKTSAPELEKLLLAGAHLGYGKSTRHPKMQGYIFGSRNNIEIFNLERTEECLAAAEEFLKDLGRAKKTVLWVGTKPAASAAIAAIAQKLNSPYVNERWLGGTLTNFKIIETRLNYWANLEKEKEAGGLDKYVKKEKMLKIVELRKLQRMFGGIKHLKSLPDALVIIDPKEEKTTYAEAKKKNIPVIGILNTDCDPTGVAYPIPANDNSRSAIELILSRLSNAYEEGFREKPAVADASAQL